MIGRRGFTLIEMLVSITITSVMLGIAVAAIYALMRSDETARRQLGRQTTLARLSQQFRRDVHASLRLTGPEPADGKSQAWKLHGADGRVIQYRMGNESLVRTVLVGNAVKQRESYALLPKEQAKLEMAPGTSVVSLWLTASLEPGRIAPPAPIEIDAALAADFRFGGTDLRVESNREVRP